MIIIIIIHLFNVDKSKHFTMKIFKSAVAITDTDDIQVKINKSYKVHNKL